MLQQNEALPPPLRPRNDLHIHCELILPLANRGHGVVLDASRTPLDHLAASSSGHHVPADLPRKIQDVGAATVFSDGAGTGCDYCHF